MIPEDRIKAVRARASRGDVALDEALDALARIENPANWGTDGSWDAKSYPDEIARAVLAKAGRR